MPHAITLPIYSILDFGKVVDLNWRPSVEVCKRTITRLGLLASISLLFQFASAQNVNSHSRITLQSNSDFTNCACVTSGMGTQANPYVIGPWAIKTGGGVAVSVDGTSLTASFVLSNLKISGTSKGTDTGIVMNHINPNGTQTIIAEVYGTQTSIQNANIGILVENSSYAVLDGAGANPNGPGIGSKGAGTLNGNTSGAVDMENSSHVCVRGWQLSANGLDHDPDYVAFDPAVRNWGVGGVRLLKSPVP